MENFPLICYWDGEIVDDGKLISYKGGNETFVFANKKSTYTELVNNIIEAIGVDKLKFNLSVKMKFPSVGCFKLMSLNSDRSLAEMWASIDHSKAGSMDLYVDLTPIEQQRHNELNFPSSSSGPRNLSFTRMLTDIHMNVNPQTGESSALGNGIRCDDVNRLVSLLTNNVDEASYDGNVEGDEDEDEGDVHFIDENDDDDDDIIDIVSPTAPNLEFSKLNPVDEEHVNKWIGWKVVVPFEVGGEFCIGQTFTNKKSLTQAVSLYNIKKNQFIRVKESKPHTVTFICARKPTPCYWTLRGTQKDHVSDIFTVVTYKGPHHTSCLGDTVPNDHPNLKVPFISTVIRNLVEADWGIKVSLIVETILERFNYTISYTKA
ncbi:hypothetical protein RND81_08G028100 [Saponaria officinalis]|uniref:Transposase MuDR plant domain-containing protein n=1 Tax=Saponaria officinalis TaxID=3572 RepID=A0AAW1J364_SAPOF